MNHTREATANLIQEVVLLTVLGALWGHQLMADPLDSDLTDRGTSSKGRHQTLDQGSLDSTRLEAVEQKQELITCNSRIWPLHK